LYGTFSEKSSKNVKGATKMHRHYTAVMQQSGEWWIGWLAELPGMHYQERTRHALQDTLRSTLRDVLGFDGHATLEVVGEDEAHAGLTLFCGTTGLLRR
jgi:hypothetical protein